MASMATVLTTAALVAVVPGIAALPPWCSDIPVAIQKHVADCGGTGSAGKSSNVSMPSWCTEIPEVARKHVADCAETSGVSSGTNGSHSSISGTSVSSAIENAFPMRCNSYNECGKLEGNCCPNDQGVMLDCCVLGAIRMGAEAAAAEAERAKEAANEAESLLEDKVEEAKKMGEEAKEKAEEAKEAQAAAEEAEKAAKAAQAAAEHAAEEQKAKAVAAKSAQKQAEAESEKYSTMNERIGASKCENNPACAAANLTGYCCPTLNGIHLNGTMLGCCQAMPSKGPLLL